MKAMDEKLLMSLGLSQNLARTYRVLALRKELKPSQLMKLTGESRTNCYALLDKLVEMGLASKQDVNKKFVYYPSSPLALKKNARCSTRGNRNTTSKSRYQNATNAYRLSQWWWAAKSYLFLRVKTSWQECTLSRWKKAAAMCIFSNPKYGTSALESDWNAHRGRFLPSA